jgi:hypothetical protein
MLGTTQAEHITEALEKMKSLVTLLTGLSSDALMHSITKPSLCKPPSAALHCTAASVLITKSDHYVSIESCSRP